MIFELRSRSEAETREIGRALGEVLRVGDVVALDGDLGAGKTAFSKGIGEGIGVPSDRVVSPTFTLVAEHLEGRIPFIHVDAYRLSGATEAFEAGIDELLGGSSVSVVEWAERVAPLLPDTRILVRFVITGPEERTLLVTSEGDSAASEALKRFRTVDGG